MVLIIAILLCFVLVGGFIGVLALVLCEHRLAKINQKLGQILRIVQPPRPAPTVALRPIEPELKFRVEGTNTTTGEKTICFVQAACETEAYKAARKQLTEITKIEPVPA